MFRKLIIIEIKQIKAVEILEDDSSIHHQIYFDFQACNSH